MRTLLHDVEVEGVRLDVELAGGYVVRMSPQLSIAGVDERIDGRGGALLPGLHDHHLHLLAMAAATSSLDCGPPSITDRDALRTALNTVRGSATIRGVGYHESVAGPLDRQGLDDLVADRPVRIQHRSGALWMLNSRAIDELAIGEEPGVELGPDGEPNGRLWRRDDLVQGRGDHVPLDLARIGHELTRFGITGVTDATPDLGPAGIALLADAARRGALPMRVMLMTRDVDASALPRRWSSGPVKIMVHEHDLPTLDQMTSAIRAAHETGRSVAVHCVTRTSLLLTLAALEDTGPRPGDRIEHAAVVPGECRDWMASLGVSVVTQPGFIHERGDSYAQDVEPDDLPLLYPWASLCRAGVDVAPSSDAPYGPLDPWLVIGAAASRTTGSGLVLGGGERVTRSTALAGYLSSATAPGGTPRRVRPGAPADLCLLQLPLREALEHPDHSLVRRVWHGS